MWSLQSSQIQSGGLLQTSTYSSPSPRYSDVHDRRRCRTRRRDVAANALFSPPPFEPEKLTVNYQELPSSASGLRKGEPRRYTLTHNDITGALQLTVGSDYNYNQISGFYNRLLRDEIVAEWRFDPRPSLHIFCHVSGEEKWLAPPSLRDYIFRRELPLVLDTFLWADQQLLEQRPDMAKAEVFVHFQSCQADLDVVERWGVLGQRSTWRPMPQSSLVQQLILSVLHILHIQPPPQLLPPQQKPPMGSRGEMDEVGLKLNNAVPVIAAGRLDVVPRINPSSSSSNNNTGTSSACEQSTNQDLLKSINVSARPHRSNGVHPGSRRLQEGLGNVVPATAHGNSSSTASDGLPPQTISLSGLGSRATRLPAAPGSKRVRGRASR